MQNFNRSAANCKNEIAEKKTHNLCDTNCTIGTGFDRCVDRYYLIEQNKSETIQAKHRICNQRSHRGSGLENDREYTKKQR